MARIVAPNRGYNGTIGDVQFKDGVAETDNLAIINYCRNAGYEVDGETLEADEPERIDSRDVEEVHPGTRLRDAAVDPREGDFMVPTNAGQADPHGPLVVAPGVHAAPPAPIVPGPVPGDPKEQEAKETAVAERVLVEGASAKTVARPAKSATKDAWVAYAVSRGADEEEAKATRKDDLIAAYGEGDEQAPTGE